MSAAAVVQNARRFNGVKIFSATMKDARDRLGDDVTVWLRQNPNCEVVDTVVTQSSDHSFHCLAITVFFDDKKARAS